MTRAETMRAVTTRYFTCLDTEDWDTMRELWTPTAQLRAVGARPRDGRDEIITYFSRLFTPWPHHEDRPTRIVVAEADRTVLAEVTFTGRTADGRAARFDAVDVFGFEDGGICRLTNWYDVAHARALLAPPRPTGPGATTKAP